MWHNVRRRERQHSCPSAQKRTKTPWGISLTKPERVPYTGRADQHIHLNLMVHPATPQLVEPTAAPTNDPEAPHP